MWKHDMYKGPGADLGSRLAESSARPLVDSSGAHSALRSAMGLESRKAGGGSGSALSIRGASSANVVQVENLASGTTAADVEVRPVSHLLLISSQACLYSSALRLLASCD